MRQFAMLMSVIAIGDLVEFLREMSGPGHGADVLSSADWFPAKGKLCNDVRFGSV
jgi:hypothetical protein